MLTKWECLPHLKYCISCISVPKYIFKTFLKYKINWGTWWLRWFQLLVLAQVIDSWLWDGVPLGSMFIGASASLLPLLLPSPCSPVLAYLLSLK